MAKICTTRNDFLKSYKSHFSLYFHGDRSVSPKTRKLILFYSVECGLKFLILKNIGKDKYEELETYLKNKYSTNSVGHDIKLLAKELQIDTKYSIGKIQLAKKGGYVLPAKFNEVWRYGVEIQDENEEQKIEKALVSIAEWINKRV